MPIHVLQLGPYPPPEGGITRNMLAIRERLLERGDSCSVIATSKSSRVTDDANVYRPRSAAELISLIRKIDHDILHLHVGGDINRRVVSLMLAVATFGTRPLLSFHSGGYPKTAEAQRAHPNTVRGRIFRRFERLIVVNDELAQVFRTYGVDRERLAIIVPFALAPRSMDAKLPQHIEDFANSRSPVLVAVGGVEPDYEPLFLVDAMKGIIDGHPNAGLVIVGGGSMRASVEAAVAESGYPSSILIAGDLPHDETVNLMARSDAMLRITLFDGDAISVREALFVGTPVIATDNAIRPDGVNLTPRGDAQELLKSVDEVLAHPPKRPQNITADLSNIDKVLALYDELL